MKATAMTSIGASLCAFATRAPAAEQRCVPGPRHLPAEAPVTAGPHLTPRQVEVLGLLCEGMPNKLICRRLNIAVGTVKIHISGILRELGVRTRLQAVVAANRHGLLGEPARQGREDADGDPGKCASPETAMRPGRGARYQDAISF